MGRDNPKVVEEVMLMRRDGDSFEELIPKVMDKTDEYIQVLEHEKKVLQAKVADLESKAKPRKTTTKFYLAAVAREMEYHAGATSILVKTGVDLFILPDAALEKWCKEFVHALEDVEYGDEEDGDLEFKTHKTATLGIPSIQINYLFWDQPHEVRIEPVKLGDFFEFNDDKVKACVTYASTD